MKQLIFPCLCIILYIGAAIVYGISGNYAKMLYWIGASIIVTATIFM